MENRVLECNLNVNKGLLESFTKNLCFSVINKIQFIKDKNIINLNVDRDENRIVVEFEFMRKNSLSIETEYIYLTYIKGMNSLAVDYMIRKIKFIFEALRNSTITNIHINNTKSEIFLAIDTKHPYCSTFNIPIISLSDLEKFSMKYVNYYLREIEDGEIIQKDNYYVIFGEKPNEIYDVHDEYIEWCFEDDEESRGVYISEMLDRGSLRGLFIFELKEKPLEVEIEDIEW